jgi:hypothetical protein
MTKRLLLAILAFILIPAITALAGTDYCPGQEGAGRDALVKAAIDRHDWDGATELINRIKRSGQN